MRHTFLFSILLLLTLAACNKNKFNTVPSLKFKSVNTTALRNGEDLRFILSFTDAEGDLTDTIFVQKIVKVCPVGGLNGSFKQPYKLPEFPTTKNQKGDISVTYSYTDVNPKCSRNDTATFKFVLKDKAQNKSDTVTSPPIVIIF